MVKNQGWKDEQLQQEGTSHIYEVNALSMEYLQKKLEDEPTRRKIVMLLSIIYTSKHLVQVQYARCVEAKITQVITAPKPGET